MRINNIAPYKYNSITNNSVNNTGYTQKYALNSPLSFDTVSFSGKMDPAKKSRMISANLTIHGAAVGAASAAAVLAQEPGADTAALTAITIAMTAKLCKNYGINGASTFATTAAACAAGNVAGVNLATKALTIWPGLGNAANAAITFGLHEATGWALVALCEDLIKKGALDENKKVTKEMFKKYKSQGKELKKQTEKEQGTSFKGNEKVSNRLLMAGKNIKLFANNYDTKDFAQKDLITNDLVQNLCAIYGIDPQSRTAKSMSETFAITDNITPEVCDNLDTTTKELVFDATMQAPYMVLAAYLDDKLQNGADMNNLEISVSELDKSQEKAISVMRYAA